MNISNHDRADDPGWRWGFIVASIILAIGMAGAAFIVRKGAHGEGLPLAGASTLAIATVTLAIIIKYRLGVAWPFVAAGLILAASVFILAFIIHSPRSLTVLGGISASSLLFMSRYRSQPPGAVIGTALILAGINFVTAILIG